MYYSSGSTLTWHGDAFRRRGKQNLAEARPGLGVPKNSGFQRQRHFSGLLELPQEEANLVCRKRGMARRGQEAKLVKTHLL